MMIALPASGSPIYVNERIGSSGDGSSWNSAFVSLTEALAVARPNDEIWIAVGTYAPDPAAGRDGTLTIPDAVRVFGGFRGNEASVAERPNDLLDNPTVLTGEFSDNYSVVTVSNTGSSTLLDGLVIERGLADVFASTARGRGAGIYGVNAGPTLNRVIVRNCTSFENGAGVYLENSGSLAANISASEFRDNTTQNGGGGMAIDGAAFIDTSRFRRNEADLGGGGLLVVGDGVVVVSGCQFDDNNVTGTSSNAAGGGLLTLTDPGAVVQIDDCRFEDNFAINGGGGLALAGNGRQILIGSRIFGNDTSGGLSPFGGGLRLALDSGQAFVENCAITGNTSEGNGAGVAVLGDHDAFIANTTVVGNTTQGLVSGVSATSSDVVINNSIVYSNASSTTAASRSISMSRTLLGTLTVNRSLVEFWFDGSGPLPGTGTTDADPMFVDADGNDNTFGTADDNIRLMPGSPAIDAGSNLALTTFGAVDVFGALRFVDDTGTPDTGIGDGANPIVDIGAAEFQGTTPTDCVADTNGDGQLGPNDFNAWILAFNSQSPACDQNGDGDCRQNDFNAWVLNFNAGC
ncbi:MAG: right-handed parallel beta-helix repeat-containing protein [Planctomycetota bacterium]